LIEVRIAGQRARKLKLSGKTKIADVLTKLGLARETVAVKLNGKIAPEEETVKEKDKLEVLIVVTGG
jgi:thiamine biosynthesis protein ThiS